MNNNILILAVAGGLLYWYLTQQGTAATTTPQGTFVPTGGGTAASPKIGDSMVSGSTLTGIFNGSTWHAPPATQAEIQASYAYSTAQHPAAINTAPTAPPATAVAWTPGPGPCGSAPGLPQSYTDALAQAQVAGMTIAQAVALFQQKGQTDAANCFQSYLPATTSVNPSSLAGLYQKMLALIVSYNDPVFTGTGDQMTGGPYHFNYYLQRVLPGADVNNPGNTPDLTTVFPGVNLNNPMTAGTFWAGMGPKIGQQVGLSGLSPIFYSGWAA